MCKKMLCLVSVCAVTFSYAKQGAKILVEPNISRLFYPILGQIAF